MTETKPTAKAGLITKLDPHKRVVAPLPEVDKVNLNTVLAPTRAPLLEELLDKDLELLPLNLRADPKLETEVLLQIQAIPQVTTSLELEPHNKRHHLKPKIQMLLP